MFCSLEKITEFKGVYEFDLYAYDDEINIGDDKSFICSLTVIAVELQEGFKARSGKSVKAIALVDKFTAQSLVNFEEEDCDCCVENHDSHGENCGDHGKNHNSYGKDCSDRGENHEYSDWNCYNSDIIDKFAAEIRKFATEEIVDYDLEIDDIEVKFLQRVGRY
ncbi:MAG: hypothetical protein LBN09_06515 [Clostridioides sp.]|jgi:hypothetical protein|nr:hypothetical protein [Clostridioides sp.]